MAKGAMQKSKLLYLAKIFSENTDEEHGLTVNELIDALDKTFNIANIAELKEVAGAINSLTLENRLILDLTAYNQLVAEYNKYLESVQLEVAPVVEAVNALTFNEAMAVAGLSLALAAVSLTLGITLKRKFM